MQISTLVTSIVVNCYQLSHCAVTTPSLPVECDALVGVASENCTQLTQVRSLSDRNVAISFQRNCTQKLTDCIEVM